MTGRTGSGKTAIALNIAASVALGKSIAGHDVDRGLVLYFAGENPTDVQMRWIAMAQQMGFDVNEVDVHFTCGVFDIREMFNKIAAEVRLIGDVSLVVIDTTAAFFRGEDENNNVQMGEYARLQRSLVDLPGGPTVLALCHPTKGASEENLLPRGGGAYLNEVDGNLIVKNGGSIVELHWQGKFRGPDFTRYRSNSIPPLTSVSRIAKAGISKPSSQNTSRWRASRHLNWLHAPKKIKCCWSLTSIRVPHSPIWRRRLVGYLRRASLTRWPPSERSTP